jgi:toxin CcdB
LAQFDVYRIAGQDNLAVEIQHHLLADYDSRVVVPLLPASELRRVIPRFNPLFEVDGRRLVLTPQFTAAVDVRQLGNPVAQLKDKRDKIIAAMDFLLTGF